MGREGGVVSSTILGLLISLVLPIPSILIASLSLSDLER